MGPRLRRAPEGGCACAHRPLATLRTLKSKNERETLVDSPQPQPGHRHGSGLSDAAIRQDANARLAPLKEVKRKPAGPALRVTEIFGSLQGEGREIGLPTVFVRLTGCNLRCVWCDTEYSFTGGEWMTVDDVVRAVEAFPGIRNVCLTGGEPLLQKEHQDLLRALTQRSYRTVVETSGSRPLEGALFDDRVCISMDIKCPASGEAESMLWENLAKLGHKDQLKFVIQDERDYAYAKEILAGRAKGTKAEVVFQPVGGGLDGVLKIAAWARRDGLSVRVLPQLHKLLWGDAPGH
jgi:7-carboxy-7-deazaguanine synthase